MPIVMRLSFQSETNGSFSYTIEYTYIKDRAGSEYTKKEQCDGGKFQIGNHDWGSTHVWIEIIKNKHVH